MREVDAAPIINCFVFVCNIRRGSMNDIVTHGEVLALASKSPGIVPSIAIAPCTILAASPLPLFPKCHTTNICVYVAS